MGAGAFFGLGRMRPEPLALLLALLLLERGGGSPAVDLLEAAQTRKVHAFFYLWYGNPEQDGDWQHWNHEVLPHWDASHPKKYPKVRYMPPGDIHSPFYPLRGCYSSVEPLTVRHQLLELLGSGVGVVVLSWSGRPDFPGAHDTQGVRTDRAIPLVMEVAAEVGMEVALHLEPYEGRTAESVRDDISYLIRQYGDHKALHRFGSRRLPLFYVYDSYRISPKEWQHVLQRSGERTIRGTGDDAFLLGLWLNGGDGADIKHAGFNGAYTYFAAEGFTYGSTSQNWNAMASYARRNDILFVPSVGPGYDDTKIRPWNKHNTRRRMGGQYYDKQWGAAMASGAHVLSITSYNEWGEGTQIEPAVPYKVPEDSRLAPDVRLELGLPESYSDYSPYDPYFYLNRTARWSVAFAQEQEHDDGEL